MKSLEVVAGYLYQLTIDGQLAKDAVWVDRDDEASAPCRLSAAFLRALAKDSSSDVVPIRFLDGMTSDPRWGHVAKFYLEGLSLIEAEIDAARASQPGLLSGLDALADGISESTCETTSVDLNEGFWAAFFPEGTEILGNETERGNELRGRRTVTVGERPATRVVDPSRQLLLTTNALLTVPSPDNSEPRQSNVEDPQQHWYDHPMPLGTSDDQNEILNGLRAMDDAIAFEKERGVVAASSVMSVVVSISATHEGLTSGTRRCVEDPISRTGGLEHLDVYLFNEQDTRRLVDETLGPAVFRYLPERNANVLDVIGVDGRYGRHYSFLKAIAAWWSVMADPDITSTFKFDLDQVFPQTQLVTETGRSAMEHFTNPIWGATGIDARGRPVELGMMAGSLVNSSDIDASLFTLDVGYPTGPPMTDEKVFWSVLPQALSTAAEMGARYEPDHIDGINMAIERVHVTGGTTAARVDALRRHRPFTPTFIGRAEDQAYTMALREQGSPRLTYLHADGLIMRHDKEALASEAIADAAVGKLVADHERIILFSAYAVASTSDVDDLKRHIDPFTGCFVSRLPLTVTYLRFALRALRFFADDEISDGCSFTELGATRLSEAIRFASGSPSELARQLDEERTAWELFYDVLDAIEDALSQGDEYAIGLVDNATLLLDDVAIRAV